MAKKVPTMNLASADDLFSTQEERDGKNSEKVVDIPLSEIDIFPNHPFLVKMDDSMQALIDSIKSVGIQTPAVVRLKEDGRYELISGHRRKKACEFADIETIPCIVRQMDHEDAVIAMVDANLQREVILPSEKAKSYKMRLEAMKRQAGRPNKNNSSPLGMNSKGRQSLDELGENVGESRNQIHRYIRLTELIPQLLEMVDGGQMAIRPAVELSYLSQEQQQSLLDAIESEECAPSQAQAVKMRKFSKEGQLSDDTILSIMREVKPLNSEHLKLPKEKIHKFFPVGTPIKTIEQTIIKALEMWQSK
jgi:ParB family chromosome partitioning protein